MKPSGIDAFYESFSITPEEVAEFAASQGRTGVYEIISHDGATDASRPDAICILRSGRFGNNVIQINKAIAIAQALGVQWIDLRQLELPLTVPGQDVVAANGLNFVLSGPTPRPWNALTGYFWETGLFNKTGAQNADWAVAVYPNFIRKLFDASRLQAGPDDMVTIHIRSGDLFGDPNYIVPYMTPPPLAYYALCIKHAVTHSAVSQVRVVYEDRNNPCVDALEDHLRQNGIAHEFQSSTLEDDIAAVASARHLITGPGTFAPTAALVGGHCRSIYYFRMSMHWQLLHQEGTRSFTVTNPSESYISPNDWTNSDAQRALIVDLPEDELSIRERG